VWGIPPKFVVGGDLLSVLSFLWMLSFPYLNLFPNGCLPLVLWFLKLPLHVKKIKSVDMDPFLPPQGPQKALVISIIIATSPISLSTKIHVEDSIDSFPWSHVAPPLWGKIMIDISFNDLHPKVTTHLWSNPEFPNLLHLLTKDLRHWGLILSLDWFIWLVLVYNDNIILDMMRYMRTKVGGSKAIILFCIWGL